MNIKKFVFVKDEYGYTVPTQEIYFPKLNNKLPVWFVQEPGAKVRPSPKQWNALENFINIQNQVLIDINELIENYSKELISIDRITKRNLTNNFNKLEFKSIILPNQATSKDDFLIILANTPWKIKYQKFIIEVEILLKNNQVELLQEMTGLWTRLDWDLFYNV